MIVRVGNLFEPETCSLNYLEELRRASIYAASRLTVRILPSSRSLASSTRAENPHRQFSCGGPSCNSGTDHDGTNAKHSPWLPTVENHGTPATKTWTRRLSRCVAVIRVRGAALVGRVLSQQSGNTGFIWPQLQQALHRLASQGGLT